MRKKKPLNTFEKFAVCYPCNNRIIIGSVPIYFPRFTQAAGSLGRVDVNDVPWQWKVKHFGNGWGQVNINTSGPHKIYTLLATPQAPMAVPWSQVLDIACNVASGESDEPNAMYRIWNDFYYNSGGVYDTNYGEPSYTSNGTTGLFNLTKWLTNYNQSPRDVNIVNCYDMGKALKVFANSLGCNSVYTYVGPYFGYLNCIHPIGCGWTNNPFYGDPSWNPNPIVNGDWSSANGRSKFGNHGFASIGNYIFDASVGQVDIDGDPDGGPPFTAHSLDGSDTWTSDYRNRVIDSYPSSSPSTPANKDFSVN